MTTASPLVPIDAALVDCYRDDGFVVVDDVLSPAEVESLRAVVEEHPQTSAYRESEGTVHLLGLVTMHPAFLDLARHPGIVAILARLIGPDITLHHSKLTAKPLHAGMGPFAWHQDGAFYPHTNTDVPAVMVMLDDATPENGCMSMVRGSHRLGYLDHSDDEGWFISACQDPVWEREPDRVVAVTPRAGGISIHHPLTLHGSPPNRSGCPRRGLTYAYRAADAQQLAGDVWAETGLVIHGAFRGEVRCESPRAQLPRFPPGAREVEHGSAWHQVGAFAVEQHRARGLEPTGRSFAS